MVIVYKDHDPEELRWVVIETSVDAEEAKTVELDDLYEAFAPGRWWRVVAPDGSLWCESSDEEENRAAMRPGDTLMRIWRAELTEWREVS